LERALLRGFFNHACKVWCWSHPTVNPAVGLKMPKVNNARDRVMSDDEQRRLDEAIQECRNQLVGPTLTLLTETAMRSSEPLEHARWKDVDWEKSILRLPDSKTDQREVPLSPEAIEALQQLARLNPPQPDECIVRMSYDALAAAWRRACERAGINDLRLHDLRHTSATRMALKTGNVFIVKALTGHKTMSQVERYVNVKASDVVKVMYAQKQAAALTDELVDTVGNLVRGDFVKRRVA
jgi:integrase